MKKKRIRWADFGLTVKRKSLIPSSTKAIESFADLLFGMPLRAIPVAYSEEGDPILVTIDRHGVPEFIVKWMHDGPWNVILNSKPGAYLAGERGSPKSKGLAAWMKDLRALSPRRLIDEYIYHLDMLDDGMVGPGPSMREQREILGSRIRESAEIEQAFITCGEDLRSKAVWLMIAQRYRAADMIGGFMVAMQNALGACTVHPRWGCRPDEPQEKWRRCLDFMHANRDFVVNSGDALDVATYEAMMDLISKGTC